MSTLTTLLLADAVDKGGPGSGPRPGGGGGKKGTYYDSRNPKGSQKQLVSAAHAATAKAFKTGAKEDHIAATNAHLAAAAAGRKFNDVDSRTDPRNAKLIAESLSHTRAAHAHAELAGGHVNFMRNQFSGAKIR